MNQNTVSASYDKTPAKERYPLYAEQVLGGGACRSIGRLYTMLLDRNFIVDNTVQQALVSPTFRVTARYTFLKLVLVTPDEIDLPEGGLMQSIEAQAKKHHLGILPMDTAPFLMLQMRSSQWSAHPSIVVASEPVVLSDSPHLFAVSKSQIRLVSGEPTTPWQKDQPFLFRRL